MMRAAPSPGGRILPYLLPLCIMVLGYRADAEDRDSGAGRMGINKDLVAASSTPLVLAILAEGDSYGYAILQRVRELSGGELEWTDGMLYPVLHRLERAGLVKSRWEKAETGRKRKYYRVTAQGRDQLADERRQWKTVDEALRKIWSAMSESVVLEAGPTPHPQQG